MFQLHCGSVVSGGSLGWGFLRPALFFFFFITFLTAVNLLIFNCPVYGKILSLDRINVSWKTKSELLSESWSSIINVKYLVVKLEIIGSFVHDSRPNDRRGFKNARV